MYYTRSSRRSRDRSRGKLHPGWLIAGGLIAAAGVAFVARDAFAAPKQPEPPAPPPPGPLPQQSPPPPPPVPIQPIRPGETFLSAARAQEINADPALLEAFRRGEAAGTDPTNPDFFEFVFDPNAP